MASGEAMAFVTSALSSIRRALCALFGCVSDSDGGSRELLLHFVASLNDENIYAQNPAKPDPKVDNPTIQARIDMLLKEPPNWERAYEIERLMVYLRPRRRLAIEVDRRVAEAESISLPLAAKYRAQLAKTEETVNAAIAAKAAADQSLLSPPAGVSQADAIARANAAKEVLDGAREYVDNERRAILAAVLDDLQWSYQKNNLIRSAVINSADNLSTFGLICLFVCAFPFFVFLFEKWTGATIFSNLLENFPNYGLYTAVSFGLLGAFFSRLTSFSAAGVKTVEEAETRYNFRSLIVRSAVGVCGAMILYFILRSGALSKLGVLATLVPDFEKLEYKTIPMTSIIGKGNVLVPSADWCALVLWSFLAGFSEKLVPDALAKVEEQVSGKKK